MTPALPPSEPDTSWPFAYPFPLKENDGTTKFIPLSITVSPGLRSMANEADGFQNADDASAFAFTVEPASAEPRFDAPCSKTWKPAPKVAHAPNSAHNA